MPWELELELARRLDWPWAQTMPRREETLTVETSARATVVLCTLLAHLMVHAWVVQWAF